MADEGSARGSETTDYEVEAGVHWLCACGKTSYPPFCDGEHKGSGVQPVKFQPTGKTIVHWANGKFTTSPPPADEGERAS